MPTANLEVLLEATYRVLESPDYWNDLLPLLASAAGADNAAILVQDLATGQARGYDYGFDSRSRKSYFEYYASINPWMPKPDAGIPPGGIMTGDAFLPFHRLVRSEFYTDWGKANEVVHTAAATLQLESAMFLYLSLNRAERTGPFDDVDLAPLQALLPHLHRALKLAESMDRLKASQSASMDGPAVILLDAHRRVTDANPRGEHLLKEQRVVCRDARGGVSVINAFGADLLEPHFREVVATRPERDTVFEVADSNTPIICHLQRLDLSQSKIRLRVPVAKLAIVSGQPRAEGLDWVRRLYGFTPAETQLAADLLETGALDLVLKAREKQGRRVSRLTAKTHLEALYRKTGTRRQGELVRKLAHLLASLPSPFVGHH